VSGEAPCKAASPDSLSLHGTADACARCLIGRAALYLWGFLLQPCDSFLPKAGPACFTLTAGMQAPHQAELFTVSYTGAMEKDIAAIITYLRDAKGCDFSGCSPAMLERRISRRFVATETADRSSYLAFLQSNPDELENLLNVLTINVSSFFRDPITYEYLHKMLLPEIIAKKTGGGAAELRIWSAACSKGEEAYSVAILLSELHQKEAFSISPVIVATDINGRILARARSGLYAPESIKNVKHGLVQKYFEQQGGQFALKDEIKSAVIFQEYDLLDKNSPAPPESGDSGFDLILCCNVLIYYSAPYQELIFHKLYNALDHQGYLLLGDTEVPLGKHQQDFKRMHELCHVYQKQR